MREAEIIKRFNDVWKVIKAIEEQRRLDRVELNRAIILQNALLKVLIWLSPIRFLIHLLVKKEDKLQRKRIGEQLKKKWEERMKEQVKSKNIKLQFEEKKGGKEKVGKTRDTEKS